MLNKLQLLTVFFILIKKRGEHDKENYEAETSKKRGPF